MNSVQQTPPPERELGVDVYECRANTTVVNSDSPRLDPDGEDTLLEQLLNLMHDPNADAPHPEGEMGPKSLDDFRGQSCPGDQIPAADAGEEEEVGRAAGKSRKKKKKGRRGPNADPRVKCGFETWNVGGVPTQRVLEIALEANSQQGLDRPEFIFLQEMPRTDDGWKQSLLHGYRVHEYRSPDMWRGNAIAVNDATWTVTRRKGGPQVAWTRVRRKATGEQMWLGSIYLSTGVTADVTDEEMLDVVRSLPATDLPVLLAGDFNSALKWGWLEDRIQIVPNNQKTQFVSSRLAERHIELRPPGDDQLHQPTSRPRRRGARGNQIDGVASRGQLGLEWRILVDSCRQIGTDHERGHGHIWLGRGKEGQLSPTGPRQVVRQVPELGHLDQATLEQVARDFTRPRRSAGYKDPPEVKRAWKHAKVQRTTQAWKAAMAARRTARQQWQAQRIEAAAQGNWQMFRQLTDKQEVGWDVPFAEAAEAEGTDPHEWLVDHFKQALSETTDTSPVRWIKPRAPGRPFHIEELREAIEHTKHGKSVGVDLSSAELLRAMSQNSTTEQAMLEWLERVRSTATAPQAWKTTIMSLLPKVAKPSKPKDLRPISLSSAMSKLYCHMLLTRTRQHILPQGSAQCSHSGRQTADYLFSGIRAFQHESEWRHGAHWLRLDVAKAFDRLRRAKVMQMLADLLPPEMEQEFYCWQDLMTGNYTEVRTPWGVTSIQQTRGVRQGSVESPFLFSICMELALAAAQGSPDWPHPQGPVADYPVTELLFMDDGVVQAWSQKDLSLKAELIIAALRDWGPELNAEKCTYYRSPYATDMGPLRVGDTEISQAAELQMMGISLTVPLKQGDLLKPALQKARRKYFALRHLLEAQTPIRDRLRLFDMTVTGASLWCASVVPPSAHALSEANAVQLELTAKLMRNKRKAGEGWVDYRTRTFREARALLCLHKVSRWSTKWLQRRWTYLGHISRAQDHAVPPPSSLLNNYRSLSWWRMEQSKEQGIRHNHRFYPALIKEEQKVNKASGANDWRIVARDRVEWRRRMEAWVAQEDVAWTSGRQAAIQNA